MMLITLNVLAADTIPNPAARMADPEEQKPYNTTVKAPPAQDTDPVGAYGQPQWTSERRFTTTRVYILPPGELELEIWFIPDGTFASDSQTNLHWDLEFEYGLGKRFQLDFYLRTEKLGYTAPIQFAEASFEVRYAFADWGVAWGNPTLYLEYVWGNAAPSALEAKLLLGDGIGHNWIWGVNLVYQREFGGTSGQEYGGSVGLSYIVKQRFFMLGGEAKVMFSDEKGDRFGFRDARYLLGPSMQIKPFERIFIDIVPMAGAQTYGNKGTEAIYECYLILGAKLL